MLNFNNVWELDPTTLKPMNKALNLWKHWRPKVLEHCILGDENDEGFVTGTAFIEVVDWLKVKLKEDYIFKCGVSFGKDSSVLLLALITALCELKNEGFEPTNNSIMVHSATGVDNPEVGNLAIRHWNALQRFVVATGIKLDMVLAKPSFSASFIGRVVSGRGLATMVSSSARQCSMDLKVLPSTAAVKQHLKSKGISTKTHKICLLLGSRDDEGTIRANSIKKHGGTEERLGITQNSETKEYTAYPIKHFTTQMIWEVLSFAGIESLIPSYSLNYSDVISVYADSSGECVLLANSQKDVGNSSACGARHGCWSCTLGSEDKSMKNFLNHESGDYDYLKPLARIRDYIVKTHYDWNERVITCRSIDANGYTKLQPDLYSFNKVKRILHAMLTADAGEALRARIHRQRFHDGEIPDTDRNRRMCEPQFQLVTNEDLLRVEFLWSFHQFSEKPWQALKLYDDVYNKFKFEHLDDVDDMEEVAKTPQPAPVYLHVGKDWTDGGLNQGLVDHQLEAVVFDVEGLRLKAKRKIDGKEESYFHMPVSYSQSLEVSDEAAYWIFEDPAFYLEKCDSFYNPGHSAMTLLRMGAISIAKGKIGSYQRMSERQQFYHARKLTGRVLMSDLDKMEHLTLLDKQQYQEVCKVFSMLKVDFSTPDVDIIEDVLVDSVPEEEQWDLFNDLLLSDSPKEKKVSKKRTNVNIDHLVATQGSILDQIALF